MKVIILVIISSIISASLSRPTEQGNVLFNFYRPDTSSFQEQLLLNLNKAMAQKYTQDQQENDKENDAIRFPTPEEISKLKEAEIRFANMKNMLTNFGMPFYGGLYKSILNLKFFSILPI